MALSPLNGGNFIHDDVRPIEGGPVWSRFSLKGKTAIVTGAGAGIGLLAAQALAEMGANVVV